MRAFIALPLSSDIKKRLGDLIKDLKDQGIEGKWVPPENIHLTLKFLGNIKEETINDIEKILISLSEHVAPFEIALQGIGIFSSSGKPRVLWVGIKDEGGKVSFMQRWLQDRLASLGFAKEERSFKPHLTLARFKTISSKTIKRIHNLCKEKENMDFGKMKIDTVILYESILSSEGATYRQVKEIKLKNLNFS